MNPEELHALSVSVEALYDAANESGDDKGTPEQGAARKKLRNEIAPHRCAIRVLKTSLGRTTRAAERIKQQIEALQMELLGLEAEEAHLLRAADGWGEQVQAKVLSVLGT